MKIKIVILLMGISGGPLFAMEPEIVNYMAIIPADIMLNIIAQSGSMINALKAVDNLSITNTQLRQALLDKTYRTFLAAALHEQFPKHSKQTILFLLKLVLEKPTLKSALEEIKKKKYTINQDEIDTLIRVLADNEKQDPFYIALVLYSIEKIHLPNVSKVYTGFERVKWINSILQDLQTTNFQKRIVSWARNYVAQEENKKLVYYLYKQFHSQQLPHVIFDNGIILFLKSNIPLDPLIAIIDEGNIEEIKKMLKEGINPNTSEALSSSLSKVANIIKPLHISLLTLRLQKDPIKTFQEQLVIKEELQKWIDIAELLLNAGAIPSNDAREILKYFRVLKKHPGLKKKK